MTSTSSLFTINSCVYIYIYICIHIHKGYSRLVRQLGIHIGLLELGQLGIQLAIGLLQHERSPTPNTRSIHIDSTAIHCNYNHNCVSGLHVHTILFQMCTPNKRTVQIDSTAIYHIDNHNCVLFFCRRVCMTHVSRRALFRIRHGSFQFLNTPYRSSTQASIVFTTTTAS